MAAIRPADRWVLALCLLALDLVLVAVPLSAILAAWILIARPPWFRRWVAQLYEDVAPPTRN